MEKSKLYIVIGVTAVVVIVLGAGIWYRAGHPMAPGANNPVATPSRFESKSISVVQLPPGFPTDLPIEHNATGTQVQSIVDAVSGQQQFNETYVTQFSIDANFITYKKFFAFKKWTIIQTVDQASYKSLVANIDRGLLRVIMNYQFPAAHVVSISYIPR